MADENYTDLVDGTRIPHTDHRWHGPVFPDDNDYIASAEDEVDRMISSFGADSQSRVLDIGCGQGRLAIGMHRVLGEKVNYVGYDIEDRSVDWCKLHITPYHPSYTFRHLDVHNARYNPTGTVMDDSFRFDLEDDSMDIVFLCSVFSHMLDTDARIYMKEFHRILVDGGCMFFTTFVDYDVPNFQENPDDMWCVFNSALHGVRYEYNYLEGVLKSCGHHIIRFAYEQENDRQSGVYTINTKRESGGL